MKPLTALTRKEDSEIVRKQKEALFQSGYTQKTESIKSTSLQKK